MWGGSQQADGGSIILSPGSIASRYGDVLRRVTALMVVSALGAVTACTSPPFHPSALPPSGPVTDPLEPVPHPVPRPEPPVKKPDQIGPEQLSGLNQDEVQALLGSPTTRSTQAMATEWTYRRGKCVLSLLFYPEVETSVLRVLGYEFGGDGNAATCLNRLRESKNRHGK